MKIGAEFPKTNVEVTKIILVMDFKLTQNFLNFSFLFLSKYKFKK